MKNLYFFVILLTTCTLHGQQLFSSNDKGEIIAIVTSKVFSYSKNHGYSWTDKKIELGKISAIFIDKEGIIYLGNSVGKLFLSKTKGNEWQEINNFGHRIGGITANSKGHIFVAVCRKIFNYQPSDVFLNSKDEDIAVLIDRSPEDTLISAAMIPKGVYLSTDKGKTWFLFNRGLDHQDFVGISITPNDHILLASDGGGLYCSKNNGIFWEKIIGDKDIPFITYLNVDSSGRIVINDDDLEILTSNYVNGKIGPWIKTKISTKNFLGVNAKHIFTLKNGEIKRCSTFLGLPCYHCPCPITLSTYDTEDPCEIGEQVSYILEARNEGNEPISNVTMKNIISDQMEFIEAEGPRGYKYDKVKKEVHFEPFPILQAGEKLVYRIRCKAIKEGSAKNTTTLSFKRFAINIKNEEGTAVYKFRDEISTVVYK